MNYYYHKMAETNHQEMYQTAANRRLVQECRKQPRVSFGNYLQRIINHLYHTIARRRLAANAIRITKLQWDEV